MKYISILLLLCTVAFGSKILTYNIYDRNDRVDVMLTFDTPYEGVLRQNQEGNLITIKLEQAALEAPISKSVTSEYLNKISITPNGEELIISAQVTNQVVLQASKTSDSYGLRLRFERQVSPSADGLVSNTNTNEENLNSGLPTKKTNEFEQSYYIVIGLLIVGIGILFWLKQSIAKKASALHAEPKSPWLFNASPTLQPNTPNVSSSIPTSNNTIETGGVHVRFQKSLDSNHTVAMLDYGTMSYLVVLGNNTILLDKFQDNIPITQTDFEHMLQSKHRELDGFFQIPSAVDDTFDVYKEKASGVY